MTEGWASDPNRAGVESCNNATLRDFVLLRVDTEDNPLSDAMDLDSQNETPYP